VLIEQPTHYSPIEGGGASGGSAALEYVPAERLVIAPDCGFKYLLRDVSFGKLQSMVRGRDLARAELA
jgi:methionine synthase II (cobalamin-independent)